MSVKIGKIIFLFILVVGVFAQLFEEEADSYSDSVLEKYSKQ